MLATAIMTTSLLSGNFIHHGGNKNPESLVTITEELLETIEHVANEEKLAHDLYVTLYDYHLNDSNISLSPLYDIATYSEVEHVQTAEDIAAKYGVEIDSDLEIGVFGLHEIQELYEELYANGVGSPIDAYKTGCMVEVTDVYDLNADIVVAEDSNAEDIVIAYSSLRDGSYNHYWAFDTGLKSMGIVDGCCSLGTIDGINYCHPEYPQK